MKNNKVFDDKRLLGVLDGVDQKYIAEALESYDIAEPQKVRKAPVYRRVAILAACLLLITAAFPIVNYVLPRFGITFGGNAGAGTEELETPTPTENEFLETEPEMTQTLETEPTTIEAEILDSGFDKYLEAFENMSADEIYAEVLKGGWVVIGDGNSDFAAGEELWLDFFEKSQKGESAVALIAEYIPNYSRDDIKKPVFFLSEIVFDGDLYYYKCIFSLTYETIAQGEYKFLKKDEYNYVANGKEIHSEAYILTNDFATTWKEGFDEFFSSKIPDVSFWDENEVPVILYKYR